MQLLRPNLTLFLSQKLNEMMELLVVSLLSCSPVTAVDGCLSAERTFSSRRVLINSPLSIGHSHLCRTSEKVPELTCAVCD